MASSQLLCSRRFLPLFLTQFLGALNDNFFKNAVIIIVTFRTSEELNVPPQTLVTLASALFILPYMFFCATAGKLADKYDKATVAQYIKWAELAFMLVATVGFLGHFVVLLFVVLFCMGAHSAFFSPVKYALLPDQLAETELMEGNAYIEAITFVAILGGTIGGGVLALSPGGETLVSAIVLLLALLGILTSRFIPPARTRDLSVRVRCNFLAETWGILVYAAKQPPLFRSILANSWFWFLAMIFLMLFPAYTKQIIGADGHVVTMFLTSFSIGIGAGAIACGRLLRGKVSTRFVPWAAAFMSLFTLDLYGISPAGIAAHHGALITLQAFLAEKRNWRMVFDLFMIAVAGGFYAVPLYAIIQRLSAPTHRAQVMAANNVMNGVMMVGASAFALTLFALQVSVAGVFLVAALCNGAFTLWLVTPWGRLARGH